MLAAKQTQCSAPFILGPFWVSLSISGYRSSLGVPSQPSNPEDRQRDQLHLFLCLCLFICRPPRTSLPAVTNRLRSARGTIRKSIRPSVPPRRTCCLLAGLVNYNGWGGKRRREELPAKLLPVIFPPSTLMSN